MDRILEVEDLNVEVTKRSAVTRIIDQAVFEIRAGEIVCLVGESGSGKSVTARAIMGLMQSSADVEVSGRITFDGNDISKGGDASKPFRGTDIAMVFQEPLSSLDPVFTIESQLRETLRRRFGARSVKQEREILVELLEKVGIHDGARVLRSYPHQLSGGMCQRVMIAQALSTEPKLLIADEPTTALDVTVQAQILELIDSLRATTGMSVLLVTHDMGVAAQMADRVVVMYAGRVVEDAPPMEIFQTAKHPYTEGLLSCIPPLTEKRQGLLPAIPGSVPDPSDRPSGCAFNPRCDRATDECRANVPPLEKIGDSYAACFHPLGLVSETRQS